MPDQRTRSSSATRCHIVLIPGFAGFDALGQLEYYAGVTPLFQKWQHGNAVLHYFDNFPTAAVVTRAARLRSYLAKRIARGEILPRDEIALVGHSTGGLDIRWLLWDLHRHRGKPIVVDGDAQVNPDRIIECVRRVVFLSAPHWGTNIADWVRAHSVWRKAVVADLRAAVAGSQLSLVDSIERYVAGGAARLSGAELLCAVQDALSEANENTGRPSPMRKADAQEAASELALYLRHMASDFRAIDDLASSPPRPAATPESPAHFGPRERRREIELLRPIQFRSYVTLGRRPYPFDPGAAPVWELTNPWTYPEISKDPALSAGTDIVYRTCYRACAGGPFKDPWKNGKRPRLSGTPPHPTEVWDNDGIANTLSMLWPMGENVLVGADHMDIVGQYKALKAERGSGRKYRTYDLLKSASGFSDKVFEKVWKEIFNFCLGHSPAT